MTSMNNIAFVSLSLLAGKKYKLHGKSKLSTFNGFQRMIRRKTH